MNTLDELLEGAAADLRLAVEQVPIPSRFPDDAIRARVGSSAIGARRVLIAAAVVAVVAGGFVIIKRPGSTTDSPTVIPARTTTTTTSPSAGPLPGGDLFDFLIHKDDFFMVLDVAQWNRSLECMSTHGFTLPTLPLPPIPRVLLYGMPEGTDTSRGFRMPTPNSDPSPPPSLTMEEQIAFNGPNDSESRTISLPSGEAGVTLRGGCVGESQRALFGSSELFFEAMTLFFTLQDEDGRMMRSVESSPAMRALNEEWAACMSNAGFPFRAPLEAWSVEWPDETTSEEIAAATADVECKTAVGYTSRADTAGHDIAALVPQSVNDLLARWYELSAEILARAAQYAPASTANTEITNLNQLFALTTEQSFVLRRALDIETSKCMSKRGFEYEVATAVVDITPIPTVPTAEEVELYGYMWRVRRVEQQLGGANDPTNDPTNDPSLSPEAQSCMSVARTVLAMDARNATVAVIEAAASEITQQALSDASYLVKVDDWVACLRAFGYEVEDRPPNASKAPGGVESPEAIQMAVRDYACQEQVGLNAKLAELVSVATKEWLDANPTVVAEYRRIQAELLDRAQGVTGG